jgi:hypothetical protein
VGTNTTKPLHSAVTMMVGLCLDFFSKELECVLEVPGKSVLIRQMQDLVKEGPATLHVISRKRKHIKEPLTDFFLTLVIPLEHFATAKTLRAFCVRAARLDYYLKQNKKYNKMVFYNDLVNGMMKRDDVPDDVVADLMFLSMENESM